MLVTHLGLAHQWGPLPVILTGTGSVCPPQVYLPRRWRPRGRVPPGDTRNLSSSAAAAAQRSCFTAAVPALSSLEVLGSVNLPVSLGRAIRLRSWSFLAQDLAFPGFAHLGAWV